MFLQKRNQMILTESWGESLTTYEINSKDLKYLHRCVEYGSLKRKNLTFN